MSVILVLCGTVCIHCLVTKQNPLPPTWKIEVYTKEKRSMYSSGNVVLVTGDGL